MKYSDEIKLLRIELLKEALKAEIEAQWDYLGKFFRWYDDGKRGLSDYQFEKEIQENGGLGAGKVFKKYYEKTFVLESWTKNEFPEIECDWEKMKKLFRILKPMIEKEFVKYWVTKMNSGNSFKQPEWKDEHIKEFSPFYKSMIKPEETTNESK